MSVDSAGRSSIERGIITASIMLAAVMQTVDMTIANIALPHMQGALSASQDQIAWVLTSYIVASAIMTQPTGVLATRLGRKKIFLTAVVGFTITSMLCGAATTLDEMVFFRFLQGTFGAGLIPLSQAVLFDIYPREKYGQAMAIWGMGVVVGPVIGPTLGGYLTEVYNWRWVFYVNVPVGLLATLGIMAFVPDTKPNPGRRFDMFGFALLALSLGLLQIMLDRGQSQDWFSSSEIIIECVLAVLFTYMFLVHMFTERRPFIEPGLFKDRNFVLGLLLIFMLGVVIVAPLALLPPFLQNLLGFSALVAGETLAPRGLGVMVSMFIAGRLIGKVDSRWLVLAGIIITAVSLLDMSGFNLDVDSWDVVRVSIVQGLGMGLVFVPLSTLTFSTLESHFRDEGTAMFSLIRNIGSSIGISVMMALLARNVQVNHSVLAEHITPFIKQVVPALWNWTSVTGAALIDAETTRQAAAIAYIDDFRAMAWFLVLCAPLVLLVRTAGKSKPSDITTEVA